MVLRRIFETIRRWRADETFPPIDPAFNGEGHAERHSVDFVYDVGRIIIAGGAIFVSLLLVGHSVAYVMCEFQLLNVNAEGC